MSSLLSQSLLVFFLGISWVQGMHLVSAIQVIHFVHTLGTSQSMLIFCVSATVAVSVLSGVFYNLLLYCTKRPRSHKFGLICHLLCISVSRSLYLPFFSVAFSAMYLSDGIVIPISLQVEFTACLINCRRWCCCYCYCYYYYFYY